MKEVNRFPAPAGELGWFLTANNRHHVFAQPEDIATDYDYIVVGAGFAGIMAASRLAENSPGAAIAVFDAVQVGMGDSGRNAGFMIDVPHVTVGDPKVDADHHKWRLRLNKVVIDRMRSIKEQHNLQVDWNECGKYLGAREQKCFPALDNLARFLEGIGSPSTLLDREQSKAALGTDYYLKTLFTPGTILINPAEVVRGIATTLPDNVQIHEKTAVVEVSDGMSPSVRLANGKVVRAKKIILTVSAFINHFGIQESGRMFGINSFGAFTRVLSDAELEQFKGIDAWGCTAAHPAGSTVRFTSTKRIFVRNGFTFSTHQCTSPQRVHYARKQLRRAFEARFPALSHVNFEYVHGGMIPLTRNTQSLFGSVGQNVFAGTVGDGLGLTRSSMLGHYLADMVCGVDSEELRYMARTNRPSWCPPEPFLTAGATAKLAYEEFTAGEEI
ncbi:NAD(P)/FAD-dependent oxidoreductase [Pseudomonas putida]|uniref:NAD(P)/FAD-dependent oxidoreductase n=1 Tax=Pseudomonas putida TaxID=303 RepID=UPI003F352794